MDKINIGIIGAGRIGKIHAVNLVNHPHVRVMGISDIRVDHIAAWADGLGIPIVTTNNNDILEHPEIDAVFVCSSTDTHVDIIVKAAESGKHIFCEKPVSLEIEMTMKAIKKVAEAGVKFQAGFNRRFDVNFMRIRENVQQGKIGDPHIVRITSRDPEPPPLDYVKRSGGMFIDMTIHDFDMARYLSGSDIEEVSVQGAVLVDPAIGELGDIDTAIITLRFANGALGVIDNSRKAVYGYDQRIEVFGSKGSVSAKNEFPNTVEWSTVEGVIKDKPQYFFLERYEASYKAEVEAFIHAIKHREETSVNEYDGFQAELIALAAQRSFLENRPVKVSEVLASITKEG